MKVVLSGIYYPLAILRYFEAALKRRKDTVELFTIGPYTGNWIPWASGITIKTPPEITIPNLPLSRSPDFNRTVPIGFIESKLPWKPDLWLQIDAGFHFKGKPENGLNFIVGTDPHVLNYDYQRSIADAFFCMQTPYAKSNDVYLPYAYDPVWHGYNKKLEEEIYDVAFVGIHYENRIRLVEALRTRGINVNFTLGKVYYEAKKIYHQAPLAFNWSSQKDLTARVFELLGMRRLAVVNKVPDLSKFFEAGKDLVVFDNNLTEAAEKISYYLTQKGEALKIAAQGYKTVQPYTWDVRIEQILNQIP